MENNLLDFGNTAAAETTESKRLWARMLQWKLAVAVLGTILSAIVLIMATLIFLDSINSLNNYREWFAELGENDFYIQRKRSEVIAFGGITVAVLLILVGFIYLIINTGKGRAYPQKASFEKVLPAMTSSWLAVSICLSLGLLSAVSTVGYSIFVSMRPISSEVMTPQRFTTTPILDATDSFSIQTNVEPMVIEESGGGAGVPPPIPDGEIKEDNDNK